MVVTTPTASGKTSCYNLPVLDRILKHPETRQRWFLMKALAQDQMAELHELTNALKYTSIGASGGDPIGVHTDDGQYAAGCAAHDSHPRPHRAQQLTCGILGILVYYPRWAKLSKACSSW